MKIVDQLYLKTPIGTVATINSTGRDLQSLEEFKPAVEYMHDLQTKGKIKITVEHEESAHGSYVDLVMFRRLE